MGPVAGRLSMALLVRVLGMELVMVVLVVVLAVLDMATGEPRRGGETMMGFGSPGVLVGCRWGIRFDIAYE